MIVSSPNPVNPELEWNKSEYRMSPDLIKLAETNSNDKNSKLKTATATTRHKPFQKSEFI
jgi:hypothetical protein